MFFIVSLIIPAYNEGKTISAVINTAKNVSIINEIIVVNDGSSDNTSQIAKNAGVIVIDIHKNSGKGAAINAGLKKCKNEIIMLLDADLVGLKKEHLNSLVMPIIENIADMSIGIFKKGDFFTDLSQTLNPWMSGQRVLKKRFIKSIKNIQSCGYGLELLLTLYAKKTGLNVKKVYLNNLTQVVKEKKFGFALGFVRRLKMYVQIITTLLNYQKFKQNTFN